jgi:dihydroflavonol-4-reductase
MTKTLVTGATGLLGSHLLGLLREHGYQIRVLVRTASQSQLFPRDVEVIKGDIRDPRDVDAAVSGSQYVFHCCSTHVYNIPAEEMWKVNVEGTRHVCDAVQRHDCERLIFTGTVSTLSARSRAEKPDPRASPRQRNSINKQLADELVVSRIEKGLRALIVSPSFFIGPFDYSPSPFRLWIPMAIIRPIRLVPNGGFNVVGAADVARVHLWALKEGRVGEHYPIVGENLSLLDYARMVNHAVGSDREPKLISPRALRCLARGRVFDAYVAAMLCRENVVEARYNYPFPIRPVARVIDETVDWFKSSSTTVL